MNTSGLTFCITQVGKMSYFGGLSGIGAAGIQAGFNLLEWA